MTREEAIKAIKAWDFLDNNEKEVLETLIPELAESEDERIRKELLESFKYQQRESRIDKEWLNGIKLSEVVAWLEKQDNTNETINREEFAQGVLRGTAINLITWIDYNAAEGNPCLSNIECKDIEDALVSGDWNKIYAYMKKKLERQEEQKHIFDFNANNWYVSKVDGKIHNIYNSGVEPKFHKFHEGDWVIFNENHNCIYQVERIDKYRYYLRHYLGGTLSVHFDNELLRQWTIQDAKDGDILASDNSIFIFQEEYIAEKPTAYCGLMNGLFIEGNDACWTNEKCYPANKEQRDFLFQEIKKAGYVWDKEKKELKKIVMKVFCCKNEQSYGGGLILVAANTKEEAYLTAAYDDKTSYLFDWYDDDYIWCEPDGNINHCTSDTYPLGKWYEVEHLSTDLLEPQIIVEDHYSE